MRALTLLLASSYPLYVQLDALPRADAVGPPVPDRYPWLVAAALAVWLGARSTSPRACAAAAAVLSFAALLGYCDAAAITGVARPPHTLAACACAALLAGYLLRVVVRMR